MGNPELIRARCKVHRIMQDGYWALLDGKHSKQLLADIVLHLLDEYLQRNPEPTERCCDAECEDD